MKSFLSKKLFDDADDAAAAAPEQDMQSTADGLEALQEQNSELEAKILRLHADIANMQRHHTENSRRQSQEGTKRLLDQLLPSIDTLDLALSSLPAEIAAHPWTEGLRQFEKLLQKALTDAGLQKITIIPGETHFDPQFHEAIGKIPAAEGIAEGAITQVYQQGYMFQETVLRTAKVQVAD